MEVADKVVDVASTTSSVWFLVFIFNILIFICMCVWACQNTCWCICAVICIWVKFVWECQMLWGVSVCIHAWEKNVKNFTDPHDIGQLGLGLRWGKVIASL